MNKDDFDQLFDRIFDESVKNHNFTPDSGPSWEKLQKKLKKRSRRASLLRMLPYVAASFLLGAFVFGTPAATNAFDPIHKAFISIKDGVVSIVFGSDNKHGTKPLTPPPPNHESAPLSKGSANGSNGTIETKQINAKTWKEAVPKLAFEAPAIEYVPEGFELENVNLYYLSDELKSDTASLTYTAGEGKNFIITLQLLEPNALHSTGSNNGNITFKTIMIDGNEAYLMATDEGTCSLEFMRGLVYISIIGFISPDEVEQIAEGLYP